MDLACLTVGREVERLTMPNEDGTPGLGVQDVLKAQSGPALEMKRLAGRFASPWSKAVKKMPVPEWVK